MINARAETPVSRPSRRSFRERRCLIPAAASTSGGDEREDADLGQPSGDHSPSPASGPHYRRDSSGDLHSCAIVTCEPGELFARFTTGYR
jgi:putative SOS response-associated peptidase YedK